MVVTQASLLDIILTCTIIGHSYSEVFVVIILKFECLRRGYNDKLVCL